MRTNLFRIPELLRGKDRAYCPSQFCPRFDDQPVVSTSVPYLCKRVLQTQKLD